MSPRDLPNLISLLRILMVAPVVFALLRQEFGFAFAMFLLAAASDGLDGYLAKRFNWTSRLGSILDPVADKLLLVSVYLILGWEGHVPAWLVAAIIARDLVIFFGALAYHYLVGHFELAPSFVSKLNTLVQLLYGVGVVAALALGIDMTADSVVIGSVIVLITTALSGLDYVWTWGVRAWQAKHLRHGK